jgi:polysaccharide biosynthesis/export protein
VFHVQRIARDFGDSLNPRQKKFGLNMIRMTVRLTLPLLLALSLAACAMPRGAPVQSEVLNQTAEKAGDFSVIPVSRANVATVSKWARPAPVATAGWPRAGAGGVSTAIAPGDRISLTIWENDDNPLLTPRAQRAAQITDVVVSPTGTIFLPYLGDFLINHMTADQARTALQEKLSDVLSAPQVQLSVAPGRQNTVDLVGGVARAGSYPLPDRNFSVLSLLSQGGGIPAGLRNPQLRLVRGNKIYGIAARHLMENPQLDARLRGGDKVIVEEDRRYFLALGASAQQNQIFFPEDNVSALDAAALIGGVAPARANPAAVLILRNYRSSALRKDGSGPDNTRMVFTVDLTSADGLFSAQQFRVEPNDLVMVTEAPLNKVRTIMGLIGQSIGILDAASNTNL